MIKIGKYQHFKGNYYQVLSCARHSETQEWFVVYHPSNISPENLASSIWIRPLSMFDEQIEREGKIMKRFTYVGN
jgi:hypothetical protein